MSYTYGHYHNRKEFVLKEEERNVHTHIIGASGFGKSFAMNQQMRADIENGNSGLCLIDPHGNLFQDMLAYCAAHPKLAKRTIIFDPANSANIVGFNPLLADTAAPDFLIEILTSAILKSWDQENDPMPPFAAGSTISCMSSLPTISQ